MTSGSPQERECVNPNEHHVYNNTINASGGTIIHTTENNNTHIDNFIKYDQLTSDSVKQQTWSVNSTDSFQDRIQSAEIVFSGDPERSYIELKTENSFEVEIVDINNTVEQTKVLDDKKNLKLDFSNILTDNTSALSIDTPEVIRTALSMTQDNFNLVSFINDVSIFTFSQIASIQSVPDKSYYSDTILVKWEKFALFRTQSDTVMKLKISIELFKITSKN